MKNTMTNSSIRSVNKLWTRVSIAATMFAFSALLVGAANAGVDVSKITRGNVSFSQDGNRLVVRASNGSIIEYNRFSVEAGQIMQFIQPGSTSRVLNRVTGAELSRIDGSLLSNGIVYLVNPQGIRIGNGALINVGGFYAAAGAMSDNDFIRGSNNFTNLSGKVINEGMIQAQSVALVGQYVANHGTINVDDGMVAMAAGDTVFLQNGPSPFMVTVNRSAMGADGSGAGTEAAVTNTGTINAGRGRVSMGSGDFYALGMNLSGTIIGKSIAARSGKGSVLAVNGTLDASDSAGKGGDIDVFGDRVGLFGNALVNANGATGGGSVRIGGDYLGSNAENAPQANRTVIGTDARITANATQSGNGGRVIVWSNEYTGFFGAIQANGAGVGNGGFVETSSHDNLQAFGSVTASSVLGTAGTWLMDPSNVEITIATNSNPGAFVTPWVPTADSSQISAADIVNALDGNTSVQIQTNNGTGTQLGNITMAAGASISSTGTATLTLIAAGNINITEFIAGSSSGFLSVVLGAFGSVTVGAPIDTNGGNFTIQGADATGANLAASAGSVSLTDDISTGSGDFTINATGAITQSGGNLIIDGITSVTTGSAQISLDRLNFITGEVHLNNTGSNSVKIKVASNLLLGSSSIGGNLEVTTGAGLAVGGLTQIGALTVGGTTTITSSAALTDINLSTQANNFASTFTLGTPGNVQDFKLRNTNAAAGAIGGLSNAGLRDLTIIYNNAAYEVPTLTMVATLQSIAITAGGAITQGAGGINNSTLGGTSSFTTTGFAITLTQLLNNFGGAVSLTNTGVNNAVAITDANTLTLGTLSIGGNLTTSNTGALNLGQGTVGGNLSATSNTGAITQTGALALTITGTSNINAGAAAITLTQSLNNFIGAVSLTNTGANAAITDANALILDTSSVGGTLTLRANGSVTIVPSSVVTVGGNLLITSAIADTGTPITQDASSRLVITGTSQFTNYLGGGIQLLGDGNVFTDAVSLSNSDGPDLLNGGSIHIVTNAALKLGTVTMTRTQTVDTLNITAGGDITQTGSLKSGSGAVSIETTAPGSSIRLTNPSNDFRGVVSLKNSTGGGNIAIQDSNGLILSLVEMDPSAAGSFAITAATSPTDRTGLTQLAGTTITTGKGDITISVTGAGITLNNPNNDFNGTAALNTTGTGAFAVGITNGIGNGLLTLGRPSLATVSTLDDFTATADAITLTSPLTTSTPNAGTVTLNATSGLLTINVGANLNTDGAVRLTGFSGILTAGNVTTNNANVDFFSPVILTGNVVINTGAGLGGNIKFSGSVQGSGGGTQALTLTARTGDITFTGELGTSAINLGAITINSAKNVSAMATINAASFTQGAVTAGTGTTTFEGAQVYSAVAGLNVKTNTITLNNTVDTAGAGVAGVVTLNAVGGAGGGILTILAGANISSGGAVSLTGASGISTGGTVSTLNGNVTMLATSQLITLSTSADITANDNVLFTANSASGGITTDGSITTTGGGTVVMNTTGVLNIQSNADIVSDGLVSFTGGLGIQTAGNVTTTNDNVDYVSDTTLLADVVINTGAGSGSISFATTLNGTFNLDLTAGIGDISVGNVGTGIPLGNVTIQSAQSTTFSGSFSSAQLNLVNPGTTLVNNNLTLTDTTSGLTVSALFPAYNISILGALNDVSGNTVFNNTGTLIIGGALGSSTFRNGITATAPSSLTLRGSVISTIATAALNLGAATTSVLLGDNTILQTNDGNITLGGTLNASGAGVRNLTLTAGNLGDINFSGVVGAVLPLGAIHIVNAHNVTAADINARSFVQLAGTGTTTFNGAQIYSALAGLNVVTDTIALNSTVNTVTAGSNGIVTLNANNLGDVLALGTLIIASGANISSDGAVSFASASGIFTAGNVTTSNDNVTFTAIATTLTGNSILNTGLGLGNISFSGALNGNAIPGIFDLALAAGTGTVTFDGAVGGLIPLSLVTVTSASSTTANGSFSAGTLALVAPGTTAFNGDLTLTTALTTVVGAYNISILGAANVIAGNTLFRNTSTLTIGQALGTTTFTGGVTATALSSVILNGTVATTTVPSNINFANAGVGIFLGSNTTLSANGTVSLNVVNGTASMFDLNIAAASLVLGGNITNVDTLTIQNISSSGDITLMGAGGLAIETPAEWNRIQPSVSSVVLGNTTNNVGAITVAADWINNSAVTVDFLSGGAGKFNVNGLVTGTGSVTVNGSGNSTNINANMTQASFNILDSVVVGGGAGTRTLTATGLGGVVINSTGFVNGISATAAATSLALLTTFATAPISVTGTLTAIGGSALTGLTMGGSGVDASTITLAASGTILGALSLNNASGINLNSNSGTLTAASMFFGENATLTGDSALQSLTSFSANAISGTASMFDLNIAAASLVLGGNITNVDTLTIQNISSSGDITLMGAGGLAFETQAEWNFIQPSVNLIVLGSTLHTGATTVDAAWTNNSAVRADFLSGGAGKFNINGVVTGTGNLTVNGSGISTNINANATQGFFIFNDPVVVGGGAGTRTLTATAGDVLFNGTLVGFNGGENLTVIASNSIQFNDLVGGTTTATQLGTLTVDCGNAIGNTITFANAAATVRAVDVKLNTNTLLTTPATVATIVARGDIFFSNNTFEMGQNEKLTSLGNIRMNGLTGLNSNATSVTFGDVNAVGNLRVNSAAITLLARASGRIVTNTGRTITDPRVDYVVGGQVFFSVAPVMGGSGGKAVFSNPTNNVDGSGTLSNYAKSLYPRTITAALLTGVGGQVLDLSAYSALFKYGNPANIIPQAMASLPAIGLLGDSETLDSEEATALKAKKAKKDANTAAAKAKKSASTKPAAAAPVPVASR